MRMRMPKRKNRQATVNLPSAFSLITTTRAANNRTSRTRITLSSSSAYRDSGTDRQIARDRVIIFWLMGSVRFVALLAIGSCKQITKFRTKVNANRNNNSKTKTMKKNEKKKRDSTSRRSAHNEERTQTDAKREIKISCESMAKYYYKLIIKCSVYIVYIPLVSPLI